MKSGISAIEAQAHHDAPVREVSTRVGTLDGKLYLDLCDTTWRAIEIDKAPPPPSPSGRAHIDGDPRRNQRDDMGRDRN